MSGLFGYLGNTALSDPQSVVRVMGDRMRHHDRYTIDRIQPDPRVGLGQIGIGIFNREPLPKQADAGIWLILCGELYHQQRFRDLHTPREGLSHHANDIALARAVYLRDGAEGLALLEGAFIIAVWDERLQQLSIVNDRYGLYPHYYAQTGGRFVFAPEIKGVLAAPDIPRHLDMTAIAQYTRFQQLLGERTWFEDVRLVPPATIMRYRPQDDQLTSTTYWDWSQIPANQSITFAESVDECVRLFQRAIDVMVAPPYRVGVYLSGGLDGRTILGFAGRERPLTSLTFGAVECLDVRYAIELARRAGSQHHIFPFSDGRWVLEHADRHLALTEGQHSWIHSHGMSTLDKARELIDVNLSGWDGGTIMGGLGIPGDRKTDAKLRHAPNEMALTAWVYEAFCHQLTWPGLTESEAHLLFRDRSEAGLHGRAFESLRAELARTAHYPADRRPDYFYIEQHDRRLTQHMLVFARSMIEVRCPFFDYDLVTFIYSLPEHIRTTAEFHRAVLTRRAPHLALVPYDKDNRLPHSNRIIRESHATMQRVKSRINRAIPALFPQRTRLYADYEEYLRTDLRAWGEEILFAPRTTDRGLFNVDAVRALWERHQSGKELWTIGKIASLMSLELVLRTLYDP